MNVAVIPARGGSERIPRKNIKEFCGKPIIAYSLEAARSSGLFEHVLVSTDDDEIADVARSFGGEVPFRRPPRLADAHTGTTEVVSHAASWIREAGWPVAALCCIYPTAPMLAAADLRRGLERLESGDWSFAFSACEYASPIFRAFRRTPADGIEMFFPEAFGRRSQDLPRALHDAAQFYWGRPDAWIEGRRLFDVHSTPVLIESARVRDIDTDDDWRHAELMYRALLAE